MGYDPESNTYICAAGKRLSETQQKKTRAASGLEIVTSIYECADCTGCPLKEKCIRACGSKKPLEERHKVLHVSKRFARQREDMEAKISTPKGQLLRVNRSIQAEGTFAYIKQDLDFRRFLLRGEAKVAAEWLLFSLVSFACIIKRKRAAWEAALWFRSLSPPVCKLFFSIAPPK